MPYNDAYSEHDIDRLLEQREGPCVSIILPTTPVTPDSEADRIELKNLRSEAFDRLTGSGVRRPDAESCLEPVDDLLEDESFWPYLSNGLAVFCGPGIHSSYRLPISPAPQVFVGDRFLLKPLLPLLTGDGVFFVLALSENQVRLFEGTRDYVAEVPVDDLPKDLAEAMTRRGRELRQPNRMWQGDEGQKDLYRKYFRQIDRALRPVLGNGARPMVLAGVDYLLPIYRQVNGYRSLLDDAVVGNPDRLSPAELHERAWPLAEAEFSRPRQQALAEFSAAAGTGRTSQDLGTILSAASDGRVQTLFVSLDASVYGTFDPETRNLTRHEEAGAGDRDLTAVAARWAYRTGAAVYCGEPPEIPEGSPVSATFRYALS